MLVLLPPEEKEFCKQRGSPFALCFHTLFSDACWKIITLGSSALQKSRTPQGCGCRHVLSRALIRGCAQRDRKVSPVPEEQQRGVRNRRVL